jgi:hypothetical protein
MITRSAAAAALDCWGRRMARRLRRLAGRRPRLAHVIWLQRDYVALPVPASLTAAQHRARTTLQGQALIRRRIIALYHEADAPAQASLWAHGWPAFQ